MGQILLELPSDQGQVVSLRECLKHHFTTIILDGPSKWNCPRCKQAQRTQRSTHVWSLPPVLVICLKRFAHKNGEFVKNNVEVDFDINNLDMSAYIHKNAYTTLDQKPIYQLYAITASYFHWNALIFELNVLESRRSIEQRALYFQNLQPEKQTVAQI
jgi:ubiquitin C-terminal hydrolase